MHAHPANEYGSIKSHGHKSELVMPVLLPVNVIPTIPVNRKFRADSSCWISDFAAVIFARMPAVVGAVAGGCVVLIFDGIIFSFN